ncbi:uncharacterized protein LOC124648185 [Lolium rigidum]|uniref:uncharacterized protein LOC124648185 n=1 Tax=Lolium rigidum TaxID=89674 RepID=UPI001F5DBE1A|nr:uncharacterized protein LOC124648185 [Lolium rigidum]
MQILRLLAARRAASIATASPASDCRDDDEGPFFDLDFSSCSRGISTLRSLSFGPRKSAPLYGGRHSFARSSSGRHSFARSSTSSARSLRLFLDTPAQATDQDETAAQRTCRRAPSRDVIRRYLSSISRRLRTAASPRASTNEGRGLRRLRKCRSASSVPPSSVASRCDDSAIEKQDGIAGAIAHCKDSLHRASTGEM